MKIERFVIHLVLLLCVLRCDPMRAAEPGPARLAGLVHLDGTPWALLEISTARRVDFPPPLVAGDMREPWELVQINEGAGSVTLSNHRTQQKLQLALTNAAPAGPAPPTLRFEGAALEQILEVWQKATGRTLVRAQKLPDFRLSLTRGSLSKADATTVLGQMLAASGLVVSNVGAKFAAVVPAAEASALATLPPLPAGALKAQDPAAQAEMVPPGMIRFLGADIQQVLSIYALYTAREVLYPEGIMAKITLSVQTPLTRAEASWLVEASCHLAGYDTLALGDRFVCVAPPEVLKRVPAFDAAALASRAKSGGDPVSMKLQDAEAGQILDLYALVMKRQALPLAKNLASRRLTVLPNQPVPSAEAAYMLEIAALLNGLRLELVGSDQVQMTMAGVAERKR